MAELDSRFNKRDVQDDCLADARYTLGLQIIDRQSNSKLSSLAHQVIAEQKLSTALAEEMRILYVATTRARDRLILTACQKKKNCRDIICNGFFFGSQPIAAWQLRRCQCPLEWLLYGLCDQNNLHNAFETPLAAQARNDELFSIKLYNQKELQQLSNYVLKLKTSKSRQSGPPARKSKPKQTNGQGSRKAGSRLLSQVKKSLAWRYRFGDVPALLAKQSVTQLTHRADEYVKIDYSGALERKPKAVLSAESVELIEGRLIGTATHQIIARLDLARPITKETIEETKEKLLVDETITELVAGHINAESITTFFESELGQSILDGKNKAYREWPFTFALPACELSHASDKRPATSDELIVVQGIIDMLVQTPQGLLVIDFKTDRIAADQVPERAELYRRQLELYSRAAGAILKTEILAKWLYFLTPGCAIEVLTRKGRGISLQT